MTNKDILREIIWLVVGLIFSYAIAFLLLPTSNIYLSDIYVGTRPDPDAWTDALTNNFFSKLTSALTFLIALFFLFPFLFVINSIRGLFKKFSHRPSNIFLLFVCFVSLLASTLFLLIYEPIATMVSGSWTIYPPLSALPDGFTPPNNLAIWFYSILGFIIFQALVLIMTARQVFKK